MEYDIFKAGVSPGSPTTQNEIKMLVCYILSKTAAAMNFAQLHESLAENNLVNYFDLISALDGLVETGHLQLQSSQQGGGCYLLTTQGESAAQEFSTDLPPSVRDKAVKAALRILKQSQRLSEISFSEEPVPEGGYQLHFSIPASRQTPGAGSLISFSVFAPSAAERDLIRKRFLNDPLFIYKGVMALLVGNREILGELLPNQEELF